MDTTTLGCAWRCGDDTPDHKHYAVLVRDSNGKLLGRLTPDGHANRNRIYAAVLSKARAERIAADITAGAIVPGLTAKVIDF